MNPGRGTSTRELEVPIYDPRQDLRPERTILVGFAGRRPPVEARASLDELGRLADTAGTTVVGELVQKRGAPHPATLFSKGKVQELKALVSRTEADTVVSDEDLTPAQVRNLEKSLDRKVVDRSELILAIFARHARTREARLQVEVAQLEYNLPRLRHMWKHLERLGGGIGTRGPGETQLESDRRAARDRIAFLKRRLADVDQERKVQRRGRSHEFRVAVIGYTNAGKSTLFNALTRSEVRAEDRLFATLDATTRRLDHGWAGPPQVILLTDTVGFIRKLPHHLVASFRSTLAEVVEADLWLYVVDASDPAFRQQIHHVDEVLASLAGGERPSILVFNKIDAVEDEALRLALPIEFPGSLRISARTGEGLNALRDRLIEARRDWRGFARDGVAATAHVVTRNL